MINKQIILTLKDSYPKNTRKQLIKSIIEQEKQTPFSKDTYNIINQIFSYVLKECNWDIANNSQQWDNEPLKIMKEVFPNIEKTKWHKEQIIVANNNIKLVNNK